jgi:hypothetical protein
MASFLVVFALACLLVFGCSGGNASLPTTITVELPDGSQVETTLGSGVISFADSSWQFYAYAGGSAQAAPFVTVRFGPNGELAAFENNTLASEIFGSQLLFDGQRHPTTQEGLEYAAATYGAETSDAHGFAFEGRLVAYIPFVGEVADATASASGEFEGDDINTVRGTFEFESHVTFDAMGLVPEEYMHMQQEFDFIGHRVLD